MCQAALFCHCGSHPYRLQAAFLARPDSMSWGTCQSTTLHHLDLSSVAEVCLASATTWVSMHIDLQPAVDAVLFVTEGNSKAHNAYTPPSTNGKTRAQDMFSEQDLNPLIYKSRVMKLP